ncbi:BadF/BadG/BcrA/BcrD ATPase family protein, partial [Mycobacterium sp.]|uniref:BadF/BadG/BcrA/BcrD ATPase family protein n=1 Tax=Mycobacterium sp. TaxID=1785 RepID=UPI003A86B9BB
MILSVDLGKTWCRAACGGRRVRGPGAPGLAAPGGVRAGVAAILAAAGRLDTGRVEEVIVGAAGALGAPEAARELGETLLGSLGVQRVAVTSDAVIAHAGALGGRPGAVLVVGTGVVALSISADGTLRTADGLGPLLGDEGGGGWIGAAGLRAALRAFDGRGPATSLLDVAVARFGPPGTWPGQLADAAAVASFAPDVLVAGDDAVAAGIVGTAVELLAAAARAVGDGPVAMVGGLAGPAGPAGSAGPAGT